jgi:aminopeptidase N
LLGEIFTKLAPINQNSVVSLLRAFDSIDLMEEKYYEPLIGLLVSFRDGLDPGSQAVVLHTIRRLLLGAPKAVRVWESANNQKIGIS